MDRADPRVIVRWSVPATRELDRLRDYHADSDRDYAGQLTSRVLRAAASLGATAFQCPIVPGTEYRKLSIPPYLLLFTVNDGVVAIDRIRHARQNWRP